MKQRNLMRQSFVSAFAALVLIAAPATAIVIYVDDDAPPGGDGLTWDTAFRFLQDAATFANVNANDVDEVRIAQGLYKPDRDEANPNGTGDVDARFALGSYVIFGGFAGVGAIEPDAHDIVAFETVLSGDLQGDDLPGFINYADNTEMLLTGNLEVDGITIRSAIHGVNSQPIRVSNCRVIENDVGIAALDTTVHITDTEFDANGRGLGFHWEGGLVERCRFTNHSRRALSASDVNVHLIDCTFAHNTAGACEFVSSSLAILENCEFLDNSAEFGGAIIYLTGAPLGAEGPVVNCTFRGNSAVKGGAIYTRVREGDESDHNHPSFINCVFFNNRATQSGGVMHSIRSDPKLINCTLVRNSAPVAGGISSASSSTLRVFNSIIKGNSGGSFGGLGVRTVRYSNIGGGHPGVGNIDVDPKFKNVELGNLRLKSSSPCIDAGRKSYVPANILTDILGNPRFVDAPGTPNTGLGTPPVDMGAYEFQPN